MDQFLTLQHIYMYGEGERDWKKERERERERERQKKKKERKKERDRERERETGRKRWGERGVACIKDDERWATRRVKPVFGTKREVTIHRPAMTARLVFPLHVEDRWAALPSFYQRLCALSPLLSFSSACNVVPSNTAHFKIRGGKSTRKIIYPKWKSRSRFLGRGCDEALFSEKNVFQW